MTENYSQSIGFYIQEIAKKSTTKFNQEFDKIGITYSQFRVLNSLWKKGDLTQKEIHEIIAVKPSTLTGIIDILVKKGLVNRLISKDDERFKKIILTPDGLSLKERSWETINYFDELVSEMFYEDEIQTMLDNLIVLSRRLDIWRDA
jgi:DNA-binding MarR family transcriptional regulator